MHPAFSSVSHRPWPLPKEAWRWRLSWLDLAFIHFRADAAQIQARLPAGLRVQTFDGTAWLGVVPFRMAGSCAVRFPTSRASRRFPS
jgi:hypothetical protein